MKLYRKILFKLKLTKTRGFGKTRFPKSYQKGVGMKGAKFLHDNSIELVEILSKNNVLSTIRNVFEIGSGPARNLYYLNKANSKITLYCSDLFKDASLREMDQNLKNNINFFEGDSEDIINNQPVKSLDLVLISDHLMHLQHHKGSVIIEKLSNNWSPKYILLREIKKQFEDITHPRLYHNYDYLLNNYELIFSKDSEQDKNYFIWLLKRK